MSDSNLMEDYFWILEQCPDPDETFKAKSIEKVLSSAWVHKLCHGIYRGNEEKQIRNLYLLELSNCIRNGALSELFRKIPPKGKLPPLESNLKIKIDPETVIDEMKAAAAESRPLVSRSNYQTHMSTKLFDDNQGACAYLAVSLGDPKDGPIWTEMGSMEPFYPSGKNIKKEEDLEDDQFAMCDDDVGLNADFIVFCLSETAKELAGQAKPGECPLLEEQLTMYANFIKNFDSEHNERHLSPIEFRTFLLMNFQTDLLYALQRFK